MGKHKMDKVPISLTLDREVVEALRQTKNASETASIILADNAGRIGNLTEEDRTALIKRRIMEKARVVLPVVLKDLLNEVIEELTLPDDMQSKPDKEDEE